jgi:hypothetical protein
MFTDHHGTVLDRIDAAVDIESFNRGIKPFLRVCV